MESESAKEVVAESKLSLQNIVRFAFFAIIVLSVLWFLIRTLSLRERVISGANSDNEVILARAEDAVRSAELILSFLEGASVLVTVAIGAAAVYGIQKTNELRADFAAKQENLEITRKNLDKELRAKFDEEQEKLDATRKGLEKKLAELSAYEPQLAKLSRLHKNLSNTRKELNLTINDVSFLLQADQEFRLGNQNEAYEFSQRVLEHNPDNLLALYITGWLETHYQQGKLDDGVQKLEQVINQTGSLNLKWPSAKAAYGVALRRKGMSLKNTNQEEFKSLLQQAKGTLESILALSPNLLDFHGESYWGVVGGIMRDTDRMEGAMDAYKKALQVTPGSSYPQGNFAALLLHHASHLETTESNQNLEEVLNAFQSTDEFARAELAHHPSDFFLLMDIAMADTILIYRDPKYKLTARQFFKRANKKKVSEELRNVNMRGWQFLLDSCPKDERWDEVRAELSARIDELNEPKAE